VILEEEDGGEAPPASASSLFSALTSSRREWEPVELKNFDRQDTLQTQTLRGMAVVGVHDR
jgi:hypothetical protein